MHTISPQQQSSQEGPDHLRPAPLRFLISEPLLIGLNILLMGALLAGFFLLQRPEKGQASEILPATQELMSQPTRSLAASFTPTMTPLDATTIIPTHTLTPFPSATPSPLPESASIGEIEGHKQSMPLSCEARSAVDWAAFFGAEIDESRFFNGLPIHDNPDKGFVGDVYGSWGQIPPQDYGVHAAPIAHRLREFGLNAKHLRHMTWEELQVELAAGRPVILWVVGHVKRGTPVPYTGSDGEETVVAKFEHTVIAIGYTESRIILLDGAKKYAVYQGEFLKSWEVLENQAVIWIK